MNVTVLDLSTLSVIGTLATGSAPYELSVTPNGSFLYIPNLGSSTLSVVDVATNVIVATLTTGTNPVAVAFGAGGTRAFITNESSASVTIVDTTNLFTGTVSVGAQPYSLAVRP